MFSIVQQSMKVYAQNNAEDVGIKVDSDCIQNGDCGRDLGKTLWVRQDVENDFNTFEFVTKDIFLSATFFIGTVVTFSLVYSGLMIVFGWANESTVQKGKDGVKRSLIWLILVIFSYTIIRWVQFIAQGQT